MTFDSAEKLPDVKKPFVVSVISPESVGNLLKNGDFEQVDADGKLPGIGEEPMPNWSRATGWGSAWASMC